LILLEVDKILSSEEQIQLQTLPREVDGLPVAE
jgi:hypothetical protein